MKGVAELAAEGYRGTALTDALHMEMFGRPAPSPDRTPEEMQRSWERFLEMQESLTDEELEQDIFCGRPTNVSILEDDSIPDAHSA